MKTLLVTGGAGFIGSNFIRLMLRKYQDIHIVNMDALTYAGDMNNIRDVAADSRHTFVHGNICDKKAVEDVFERYHIDQVIHFAAESHVDRSIEGPGVFVTTNVVGTQILLDVALNHWKLDSTDEYSTDFREGIKFIQISTDEVYGSLGPSGFFTEETPLSPNSPYSASKAAADMMVLAYHHTYGLPVNITRCSNNYGPYQHSEKLIPMVIEHCRLNKKIPVYGDGLQVREWIHVDDHCEAIDIVLKQGVSGEVYNVGGNNEFTNMHVIKSIIKSLHKDENLIEFVKDRLGHDRRYAIDATKIKERLHWEPGISFEEGLANTVKWYMESQS